MVQKFWTDASQPLGAEPPVPYVLLEVEVFEAEVARAKEATSAMRNRARGAIDRV